MSIHDAPLANYPQLIATLVRQRTIKIIKRELEAKGVKLHQVYSCELRLWQRPISRAIGPSLSGWQSTLVVQARTSNPWRRGKLENARRLAPLSHDR